MSYGHPIDAAILADYWAGALAAADEEMVELHLLDCDACGARLRDVMALGESVRALAREGVLRMVVSDAFLRRAEDDGLHVREYAVSPGGAVQCTVGAEDDLLVARLAADLSAARRVDLCFEDQHGAEQRRLQDIPFHREARDVVYQEAIALMKAAPSQTMVARLVSIDDAGGEQLLGEYTFNHTRTLPGPGAG